MTQQLLDANDPKVWEMLAQRAEVRLQAQLTTALAADQRAMVFAGLLAAAAAAVGGAAGVALTGDTPRRALGVIAICVDFGLLVSLFLAIYAARPSRWCFPGSIPRSWSADLNSRRDLADALREYCDDLSDRIGDNNRLMKINGSVLMCSTIFALFSLFAGSVSLWRVTMG